MGAEDEEDPTVIRYVPSQRDTRPEVPRDTPAALSASRVAVMRDAQTGRPTLLVLPHGASAPPGSAVAMLVGASEADMQRLAELLGDAVLKR